MQNVLICAGMHLDIPMLFIYTNFVQVIRKNRLMIELIVKYFNQYLLIAAPLTN